MVSRARHCVDGNSGRGGPGDSVGRLAEDEIIRGASRSKTAVRPHDVDVSGAVDSRRTGSGAKVEDSVGRRSRRDSRGSVPGPPSIGGYDRADVERAGQKVCRYGGSHWNHHRAVRLYVNLTIATHYRTAR